MFLRRNGLATWRLMRLIAASRGGTSVIMRLP